MILEGNTYVVYKNIKRLSKPYRNAIVKYKKKFESHKLKKELGVVLWSNASCLDGIDHKVLAADTSSQLDNTKIIAFKQKLCIPPTSRPLFKTYT